MNRQFVVGYVSLLFFGLSIGSAASAATAWEPTWGDPEETRWVWMNLYCMYDADKDDRHAEFKSCLTAARFRKKVTADGREVRDDSEYPNNPDFEVMCDEYMVYDDHGYRFTDHLGTRIQAEAGPYPATLLPKGALQDTHGYVVSSLELKDQTLSGLCYLYTGPH